MSGAVLDGMGQVGAAWASFTDRQLSEGVDAMRALGRCRTWAEAFEVQDNFARASAERLFSTLAEAADCAAQMAAWCSDKMLRAVRNDTN